jgi:hypothetical protein
MVVLAFLARGAMDGLICSLAVDESLLSDPATAQGSSSRAGHIALVND